LPYNVATPLISNLLALDVPPRTMTVTIQKELADRIIAKPGTKDYGSLSIWVQSQCRAEVVRIMPPSVFWPRPKVDSAIVHIELDDALRGRIADRRFFQDFIRSLFFHRRKFLRSELVSVAKNRLDKPDVDRILAALGLDGSARAETLDVEAVLALSEAFRAEWGEG
jgi:16S rRNA (adenine1518-N6/adenine1519-N6)-dimethyltransferase